MCVRMRTSILNASDVLSACAAAAAFRRESVLIDDIVFTCVERSVIVDEESDTMLAFMQC